jgi:hypothetical protein
MYRAVDLSSRSLTAPSTGQRYSTPFAASPPHQTFSHPQQGQAHHGIGPLSRYERSVEGGTARGTTALVYLQLHISLYTDTVHVLSSVAGVHPTSLTAD